MTITASHRIHRQVFELTIPDAAVAWRVQNRLSELQQRQLAPLIERCLDDIGSGESTTAGQVRIDSLVVDLGTLDLDRLEDELVDTLGPGLHHALNERLANEAAAADETAPTDDDGASFLETQLELVGEFLRSGTLPWWADATEPRMVERVLESLIHRAPHTLVASLRRLSAPHYRRRLLRHVPDSLLDSLVALMGPPAAAGRAATVLEALRASPGLGYADREGQRVFWLAVLATTDREPQSPRAFWQQLLARLARPAEGRGEPPEIEELAPIAAALREAHSRSSPALPAELIEVVEALADPRVRIEAPQAEPRMIEDAVVEDLRAVVVEADDAMAKEPLALVHRPEVPSTIDDPPAPRPIDAAPEPKASTTETVGADTGLGSNHRAEKPTRTATGQAKGQPELRGPAGHDPRGVGFDAEGREVDTDRGREWPRTDSMARPLGPDRIAASRDRALVEHHEPPPVQRVAVSKLGIGPVHGHEDGQTTFATETAGLALLWPFLGTFFDRLDLSDDGQFTSTEARQRAVALVHYLASEDPEPPEYHVTLAKVLCGMDPEEVFDPGPPVTPSEAGECTALLGAVVAHATILNRMSLPGLRATFLNRPGILEPSPCAWLLRVERQSFDVVIKRFPWSTEWVKLPFMEQPLQVAW